MINIALTSEFSFQQCYSPIKTLIQSQPQAIGIADYNNTFSHYPLYENAKKHGIKPLFGVRVMAVEKPEAQIKPRGQWGNWYILLAKNPVGLREIYKIVERGTKCFYYRAHCGLLDIFNLSNNVIVIAENFQIKERIDYLGVSFKTPKKLLNDCSLSRVALQANKYLTPDDKQVYEILCGKRKVENNTYPGYLLTEKEWLYYFQDEEAVKNTYQIAEQCELIEPLKASPIKYLGDYTLEFLCTEGAKRRRIDLNESTYQARYKRELALIDQKGFRDYFLIVAEMINKAKRKMLVGPSRGSSAGSLICYLIGITEIDPLQHGLLFERFLDIERTDPPDIDSDFPDNKRNAVVKELIKTNGKNNVKRIATISRMKARSCLNEASKELKIPEEDISPTLESLIHFPPGDPNFGKDVEATLTQTEAGRLLVAKHPNIALAAKLETHCRHTSTHAAGVVISSEPIVNITGINARDDTVMLDFRDCEKVGFIKIDCLGLANLTILEDTARLAGFDYKRFYNLPLNDPQVFNLFNQRRLEGIFQFEGFALKGLCRKIKIKSFDDIVAATALARPGPLHSGAANIYSEVSRGIRALEPALNHPIVKEITQETLGVIVYQEQVMQIMRRLAGMDWETVIAIRKAIGKSLGKSQLEQYRTLFIKGVEKQGIKELIANNFWEKIIEFGAYAFNKSHAVAYGMISYWTAWAKCYFPREYAVSVLNNTNGHLAHLRLLRELVQHEGINFIPVDPAKSDIKTTIKDNAILGGLTNIKGIAEKKANQILLSRNLNTLLPLSLQLMLQNPRTEYDILFPCNHHFSWYYENYNLTKIKNIEGMGEYQFIGLLLTKKIKEKDGKQFLNLTFEDDTDQIMGRLGTEAFDKYGQDIITNGREEKDFYLINGIIISEEIRFVFINKIEPLTKEPNNGNNPL